MDLALWTALAAGLAWIIATAVFQIRLNVIREGFQSQDAYAAVLWLDVVSGIAYPVFLVSFGLHVMMWMRTRDDTG
jgi:hypothetical protein